MSVASSLASVKIQDNIIDDGYFYNGTSNTNYTYSSCIALGSSAVVSGNTVSGCVGGSTVSTNLVTVTAGSSIICHNTFIRGGSSVNRYILVTSTNDVIITNNIFDQTTTDGAASTLVSGYTGGSVVTNNLNG